MSMMPQPVAIGLTFICVVFAWVFFRAQSIGAAVEMVKSMFFIGGLVIPDGIKALLSPETVQALLGLGLRFGSTGQHFQSPQEIAWIAIGIVICWMLPNSQTLLQRWNPGTSPERTIQAVSGIQWAPTAVWGVIIGALAAMALMSMDRVSEFLYFQF